MMSLIELAAAEAELAAGRPDQTEKLCNQVLAAQPGQPKALMLLGVAHIMRGDLGAAEAVLLDGCRIHARVTAFHASLAQLRLQTQRVAEALEPLENCVLLEPANPEHRVLLMSVYQGRAFTAFSERSWHAMLTCLSDEALSHWLIQRQWLSLLKLDPSFAPVLGLLSAPDYMSFAELVNGDILAAWQKNPFWMTGLQRFLVTDLAIERGLGFMRRWLFAQRAQAEPYFPLVCTLARYFFLTEYVLPVDVELSSLRGALLTATDVALLGCFEGLAKSADAASFEKLSDAGCYRQMIQVLVSDPLEERDIRSSIVERDKIVDSVSREVRAQYEANPYPRWSSVGIVARSTPEVRAQARGKRILVAGCGTGREAIETALVFPEAQVEAIDLSCASLSYAIRKARGVGVSNLTFFHADLLQLRGTEQRFDLIVCSGVLHHLREPVAGLRALLSNLAPSGVLRLAVYSTIGRRGISEARAWARRAGFHANRQGIQQFRAAIAAKDNRDPLKTKLASSYDFYSLSQCRDLVFHVQEHTFTCLEMRDIFLANGLNVRRVDTKTQADLQQYRRHFPNDPQATRLENWHTLETEQPNLFGGLYSFWLCRASEVSRVDSSWIDNTRRFGL